MSNASSSPPQPQQNPSPTDPPQTAFTKTTHALSLLLLLASPILLALPPRKLDLYTTSLAGAWVVSANHLTHERTGTGIIGNVGRKLSDANSLPTERAREVQARLRSGREKREGDTRGPDGRVMGAGGKKIEEGEEARGVAGLAKKLWMGQEDEGWKERRLREEREALAEGKGYGGLIVDQIWEVWNWDKKGKGAGEEKKGEGGERERKEGDGVAKER
ncbi:hypothetical protein MMC30_006238 [Trapelia coarctata]|nr:hypothetical protein [Trapelia coarctata]